MLVNGEWRANIWSSNNLIGQVKLVSGIFYVEFVNKNKKNNTLYTLWALD